MKLMKFSIHRGGLLVFALLLATFLSLSIQSSTASASTKKVKKLTTSADYATVNKKALTVKKGSVTLKVYDGYIKFKAPKTKKYTFTFSNVRGKYNYECGFIKVYSPNFRPYGTYLQPVTVKTDGGTSDSLFIASYLTNIQKSTPLVSRFITTRKASFKMKKGETAFLYLSFSSLYPTTLKLNIK